MLSGIVPGSRHANRLLLAALVGLAVAGVVSAWAGVHFAVVRSQDFQWSGERLLLRRLDPWQTFLAGDPCHHLIATQIPNYLPMLYVLLAPLGLMTQPKANLTWGLLNLTFAIFSSLVTARFYGLRGRLWAVGVTAAMLAASPTRTSISNGQQGLLVLVLWTFGLLLQLPGSKQANVGRPGCTGLFLVGVSYLKYSFAPAIAVLLLLQSGVRSVLWTLLPAVVSTFGVFLWIRQPHDVHHLARQFVAPLHVAKWGYQPTGDSGQTLMDLLEFLLGGGPVARPRLTEVCFVVAILLTTTVLVLAFKYLRKTGQTGTASGFGWLLALTATMSFVFYKHHPYDEVVFLYPLCHALRNWKRPAAALALVLISYNWYVSRFVDGHVTWSFAWAEFRLTMFMLLVAAVYRARP